MRSPASRRSKTSRTSTTTSPKGAQSPQWFVDGIRELAMSLTELPRRRKPLEEFGPETRMLIYRSRAIVVHRVMEHTADVTRVFYRGRDYHSILRRSGEAE